jgi:hypothetical protein
MKVQGTQSRFKEGTLNLQSSSNTGEKVAPNDLPPPNTAPPTSSSWSCPSAPTPCACDTATGEDDCCPGVLLRLLLRLSGFDSEYETSEPGRVMRDGLWGNCLASDKSDRGFALMGGQRRTERTRDSQAGRGREGGREGGRKGGTHMSGVGCRVQSVGCSM